MFTPLPLLDKPVWWIRDGERVPARLTAWVPLPSGVWLGRVEREGEDRRAFLGDRWVPADQLEPRDTL